MTPLRVCAAEVGELWGAHSLLGDWMALPVPLARQSLRNPIEAWVCSKDQQDLFVYSWISDMQKIEAVLCWRRGAGRPGRDDASSRRLRS
jgi:hypothetical protein